MVKFDKEVNIRLRCEIGRNCPDRGVSIFLCLGCEYAKMEVLTYEDYVEKTPPPPSVTAPVASSPKPSDLGVEQGPDDVPPPREKSL